jgi:hypothetical protein
VQARTGSTFTIAGVMAVALVLPSPADAQTVSKAPVGFTYLLVRDFDAVDTSQEMLCNYAFNDGGQLAYTSRRIDPTNSHIVTALFYWSGGAEQLVYREDNPNDGTVSPFIGIGCPSAHGIGLNNNGLIALPALGPTGFARLFFRPGTGLVDTVQTLHSNDNSRGKVNAGGQVAYWDNGASGGYVIGSEGTAAVETFAPVSIYPMDVNLGGGPTINDAGRVAMIGTDGISTFLVEHNPNVGTQIGPSSDWAALYAAPGLNKLGFTAFMTDGPQGDHPSSTFRVVMLSPDLLTAKMLADNTVFTRDAFEYSPPSLNDWNQVLIGVNDTDGTSLWILDATRQLLVFMQNQPFSANGQTISDGGLSFLYRDATINNSGDVAFDVTYTNASPSARHGIFIAHPDAGLTPANPVMPDPAGFLPFGWRFPPGFNWCFSDPHLAAFYPPGSANVPPITFANSCGGAVLYYDPPIATGYTYAIDPGSANFGAVIVPAPLPNGDAAFLLEVNGATYPLVAGELFNLTNIAPSGVQSFRITGIDASESIAATNPKGFVTGLIFVSPVEMPTSFTMVPIADSDGDGVEDALDRCPNTPSGTPVDANGCSAAQRDTDGDGVPDSIDACPGTVAGAVVDANGCSAAQRDTDHDGVPDSADLCPGTASGAIVDANGCSAAQRDTDGDGVPDSIDACPGTPAGTKVDAVGCPVIRLNRVCDADGDGDVDWRDIKAITLAIGQKATGPTDPRDVNRNGKIDLKDVVLCTSKCDRRLCASP